MKAKFSELIAGEEPLLIDFHALWCGPCKILAPVLKELSKDLKGQVRIIKIDIDKNQSLAEKYAVRGVPTLMLFKSGKLVWRKSGALTKQQILKEVGEFV